MNMVMCSVGMVVLCILFERGQNRVTGIERDLLDGSVYTNDDFKLLDKKYAVLGERLCVCVNRKEEKPLDSI